MALSPITVSLAVDAVGRAAPGRPQSPQERLPVPGRPQAEPLRPAVSPGRIPVPAATESEGDQTDMVERIDEQVKASREYQAIRPFLPEHARDRDHEREHDERPERRRESRPDAPTPVERPAPPQRGGPRTAPVASSPSAEAPSQGEVQRSDPLAFDLDGDGLETTGVAAGVAFDIDADGKKDRVSFISGGDAFLALDRNGNGAIDDGTELFGDQNGHANGFEALADYDDNRDGLIDSDDAVFSDLRLLSLNADGSQRLVGLRSSGIQAIRLDYSNSAQALNSYDSVAQSGAYIRDDGSEGLAGDLLLGHRQLQA